ncbi:MAG: hypothetical protein RLZZ444_2514 [Pseudomonadota bacterium]
MRLSALDEAARGVGLRPGQGVADARAMIPGLDVVAAEPQADRAFLEAIADWCDRYTPLVAIDGEDGLYLDITGSAHLFGGEKALLDDALNRLFHMGISARGSISSTPGLSHGLARFGRREIVMAEEESEALAPLPVKALRLPVVTVELLIKAGLRQVGDLMDQPRAPLTRRFGAELMLRLDQALGLEEEAISPRRPVAALSCERRLASPVVSEEDILALIGKLAVPMRQSLEARGEGGRLFEMLLFRVDGRVFRMTAGSSAPLRDAERISALFSARLAAIHDDFDAGYGFETLRLNVLQTAEYRQKQGDFSGGGQQDEGLNDFLDQMSARFGASVFSLPVAVASHMPERAGAMVPVAEIDLAGISGSSSPASRPLRLFQHAEPVEATASVPEGPPATFRWRRAFFRVKRAEGPERIAPEWWVDGEDARTRDYFRVEDEAGRRYWLYREGLYERETNSPRWFMHGVFA